MQMVKNTAISLFVLWLALLVFMPKKDLYFSLEQVLAKQSIVMNETSIDEGVFSLSIKGATVYFKGIEVARIEEINFFTLLFYTKLQLKNLVMDAALSGLAPEKTDEVLASHSFLSPLKVNIQAAGDFGLAEGAADLSGRTLHMDFVEAKDIAAIKGLLKKDEKGWYYETSF